MAKNIKVRLLEEARNLIANSTERYICYALNTAAARLDTDHAYNTADKLKQLIMHRLGTCSCYEDWLEIHHPNLYKELAKKRCDLYSFIPEEVVAPGRLAWLDDLIKEMK